MNARWHIWAVIAMLAWASSMLAAKEFPSASLEVAADPVQPANAPNSSHADIARVRANDAFAQYVSAKWPRESVKDALAQDLNGNNVVAADRAADGLWFGALPPPDDAAIVADAIIHHLKAPEDGCDVGLMDKLLKGPMRSPTDEVGAAISRLATARTDGRVRKAATATISEPGPGSPNAQALNSPQATDNRDGADLLLNARRDGALLMVQSQDAQQRALACLELADFPKSRPAVDALNHMASHDPNQGVRIAAQRSLDTIERMRGHESEPNSPTTRP